MNAYQDPKSLGEFNSRLAAMKIDKRLSPASLKELFALSSTNDRAGRDRVMDALRLATDANSRGSLGAMNFLIRQVDAALLNAGESDRRSAAGNAPRPERASRTDNVTPLNRPSAAPHTEDDELARAPDSDDVPMRRSASSAHADGQAGDAPERLQVKAFGSKAALCAESDMTRRNVPTVRFELATAVGVRQYDWKNKLVIQLTQDEIIEAAAVLFGFVPEVEFRNHGDDAKWLHIKHQGNSVCIRAGSKQPNSIRLVPIGVGRTTALAALLAAQLDKTLFGAGANGTLLALVGRVAGAMMAGSAKRTAAG